MFSHNLGMGKRVHSLIRRMAAWLQMSWLIVRRPTRVGRHLSFAAISRIFRYARSVGLRQFMNDVRLSVVAPEAPRSPRLLRRISFDRDAFLAAKRASLREYLQNDGWLVFPVTTARPVLSIVIVLFNKAELSLACLRSVQQNAYRDYEIVIVDNNSSDETDRLLSSLQNAVIIRNAENLHFLRANNQALAHVRGRYLLLLNSDTEVEEHSIERAIKTLEETPECGALGAKLVRPDGSLQEAGSIAWRDGSCLGYGRDNNPAALMYNFVREVDFCSGAFLMTRTELFARHGGFDLQYAPAYYEEADYCLWLQAEGYSVVYDPRVVVHHYEFGSGTPQAGIALQRRNQSLFAAKHARHLSKQLGPSEDRLDEARFSQQARQCKRLLFIEDMVPHKDQGAGFPRSNTIVQRMVALGFHVTVYPINFPVNEPVERMYRDLDRRVEVIDGYGVSCLRTFLRGRDSYYGTVWVSRPHSMAALKDVLPDWAEGARIIYDAEAIFAQREIEQRRILNNEVIDPETCREMIDREIEPARAVNAVVAVSENDAKQFRTLGCPSVHVLGHVMDVQPTPAGYAQRNGLLFVGNLDYDCSPNVDSLVWFVEKVWPLLKKEIPALTLDIIGSCKSHLARSLASESIMVHGRVEDSEPFYNRARIFVAPTRFSSGIPLKILEAAACGLPVVATTLLARQLGWVPGVALWAVEADPAQFSAAMIRAYNDASAWEQVRESALQKVRSDMSMEAFSDTLADVLQHSTLSELS